MSKAYRCDKCGLLFDGSPVPKMGGEICLSCAKELWYQEQLLAASRSPQDWASNAGRPPLEPRVCDLLLATGLTDRITTLEKHLRVIEERLNLWLTGWHLERGRATRLHRLENDVRRHEEKSAK